KEGNTNYDSMPPRRGNYSIINIPRRKEYDAQGSHSHKTLSTNYLIFDLGFANYNDKTDYSSLEAQNFLHANGGAPFQKIDINPTSRSHHGFSLSAGISAGYKIGSHTKQVSDERGKFKDHGDFNLDPWRFAYVAELGLGPVHLYGSYSIKPMFEDAVKQYPYT